MNRWIVLIPLALCFGGCLPDEDPWPLPEAPEEAYLQVPMLPEYDQQIYVDLATGATHVVRADAYDLAFVSAPATNQVLLSAGKLVQAGTEGTTDFSRTYDDPAGAEFLPDAPSQHPDSLAIDLRTLPSPVYLLDRGPVYHNNQSNRYLKVQFLSAGATSYTFQYSAPDGTTGQTVTVPRSDTASCTYFHFENGVVAVAPTADRWDLVLTRYTTVFPDQPPEFRYYSVTGALTHRLNGVEAYEVAGEAFLAHPYDSVSEAFAAGVAWSPAANVLGYDWKRFDFEAGFVMNEDRYYLLRDEAGAVYKFRFVSFLNDTGEKGYPAFLYQRLF